MGWAGRPSPSARLSSPFYEVSVITDQPYLVTLQVSAKIEGHARGVIPTSIYRSTSNVAFSISKTKTESQRSRNTNNFFFLFYVFSSEEPSFSWSICLLPSVTEINEQCYYLRSTKIKPSPSSRAGQAARRRRTTAFSQDKLWGFYRG